VHNEAVDAAHGIVPDRSLEADDIAFAQSETHNVVLVP
jgi:hypothetical protein